MFKKVFRFAVVSVLAVSMIGLAGCGSASTAGGEKVLKVGSDIAYAPFEFMDEQQKPTGFDIDLMTAIGEDMGYKVQFETSAFDGLPLSLSSGKYDAVISAMTITEERAKSILFSDPYFETQQYIAVKKGSDVKSLGDLKGKKIGVQLNTTGQFAVEEKGMETKKYDTTPDALNDLVNGGVDAVVADAPVILYFVKQNPGTEIEAVKADVDPEFYGIAFKLDNKDLADKVNATLKKFKENGKYNEIYKKWFNEDAPSF